MGWAARANPNTTIRVGGKATYATPPRRVDGPLMVFVPTRVEIPQKDAPAKVVFGIRKSAKPGTALSETHYFDGVSVRRTRPNPNGKEARKARAWARKRASEKRTA